MKIYHYKTLKAASPEELAEKMEEEEFNDNWQPVGGPFIAVRVAGIGYVLEVPEDQERRTYIEFCLLVRQPF